MRKDDERLSGAPALSETVASATECTGLVPAFTEDDGEEDASRALCGVQPARTPGRMFAGRRTRKPRVDGKR